MPNADVIRYHDTKANLTANLRAGQWGYATDTNQIGTKRLSDSVMVWFDNSTSVSFLKVDGTNSPTATIDFDGQDLEGVGDLTVEGDTGLSGDVSIGGTSDEGAEKYTDVSFGTPAEWQVAGDFAVSGGNMQFTSSTQSGNFYQAIGDMVTPLAIDTWYVLRLTFGDSLPTGASIQVQISSDATSNSIVSCPDGSSSNEFSTVYFKTQSTETNAFVRVYVLGATSNFAISDISLKEAGGVLNADSYARFQNGFDLGKAKTTGTSGYFNPVARFTHDQNTTGDSDTLRLELVQSNAVFEISDFSGLKLLKTKTFNDGLELFGNVASGNNPELTVSGYRSGDTRRTITLNVSDSDDNTMEFGNQSTPFDSIEVGAQQVNLPYGVGMKYRSGFGIGIGYQSNLMEFIGADIDTDYAWGYGTSGSLNNTMELDVGKGSLTVYGEIGAGVPMDDTTSLSASGLNPHLHLEDTNFAYNTDGRVFTLENSGGIFSLKYGQSDINGQGGVPTGLSTIFRANSPTSMAFGTSSALGDYAFGAAHEIYITSNIINAAGDTNDNAELVLNQAGYNNSTSHYRDLNIKDGKGNSIVFVDGSQSSIGIGTTSPGYDLHVRSASNPAVAVQENGSSSIGRISAHGSGVSFGTITEDPVYFYLYNTERMRLATDGDLQLTNIQSIRTGTSDGSDNEYISLTGAGGTGDTRGAELFLYGNEESFGVGSAILKAGNVSGADVIVYAGGTERMRIEYGGNTYIGGSTNRSNFASNGTLTFEGTARTWDDLRIVPGAFQFSGSGDPTLRTWQPNGTGTTYQVYCFSQDDSVYFTCQIPHGYAEGTDLKPHIHWTPRQYGTAQAGNDVDWKLDYSISNVGDVFPPSTTVSLKDTCVGPNDEHEITSSGTISGTGIEISSMLVCKLYRDSAEDTYSTTAAESPAILEFDIHFQINTAGSASETAK